MWWVLPPAFAGPIASNLLRALSGSSRAHEHPSPFWLLLVAVVLLIGMFVIVGLAVWRRHRAGGPSPTQSPLWALTGEERRRAWRQVRGESPVTPAQVPLLRLLALQHAQQAYSVALALDLAAGSVCLAIVDRHQAVRWLLAVGAAVMVGVAGHCARLVPPAKRFLRQHPGVA